MVMTCTFPNHTGKDVEFKLIHLDDGSVGLAEGSIELVCERILDPIIFHKLTDRV
jgi:hypothetical protein